MTRSSLGVVREKLQEYADRGVFRGFSETRAGHLRFVWGIHDDMELIVDNAKGVLRFRRLLPNVPADSDLYRELKGFIAERHDALLPEHRRIDKKRAEATCSTRQGTVSLQLKVKKGQYEYAVNRIVNLVHELFVYLKDAHPEYFAESFDVREE